MRSSVHRCALALTCLALATCTPSRSRPKTPTPPSGPYVVVLGSAQDAGIPQIGASSPNSRRARRDRRFRRYAASLLIADPASGKRWLIDASPDLRDQVELAQGHPPSRRRIGARPALFDGIFLTHAHIGHYAGLMQLGREAYAANRVPVYGSTKMVGFLKSNGPWSLLVKLQQIELHELQPDQRVKLTANLSVTPFVVPHRGEYTDTLGFAIRGPKRVVVYIPDIDKWSRWERKIETVVATADVALVDGTFFADGEIPGRSMAQIPHPFIAESMSRFAKLPAAERAKIHFTHLNHTNPAADPTSSASRRIRAAGMHVARDGQIIALD